jgi:hypothetical protein
MKNFVLGVIIGYLVTSMLKLEPPSGVFWVSLFCIGLFVGFGYYLKNRINNDEYGDIDL